MQVLDDGQVVARCPRIGDEFEQRVGQAMLVHEQAEKRRGWAQYTLARLAVSRRGHASFPTLARRRRRFLAEMHASYNCISEFGGADGGGIIAARLEIVGDVLALG